MVEDVARRPDESSGGPPGVVPVRCFIGLGSNLGDRAARLQEAAARLARDPGIRACRLSAIHETEPWGYQEQPAFLNAVAAVDTRYGPVQLLLRLQQLERELGRQRRFRWGPREIDLDLLLYGELRLQRRGLIIPHPSLAERAFVLVPLRELYPDYRHPSGETIDQLLVRLPLAAVTPHPA
jgi:2-amino-4-hydroxy-6-hydroxymethyldihydropteridine diphosphokinase